VSQSYISTELHVNEFDIKSVFILVYVVMVIEFPPWATKVVVKLRRRFLWRGRRLAKGGTCLVPWGKACHPPGGLGISDLKSLGWALWMHWVWVPTTEPHRPWAKFPVHVSGQGPAFFSLAVVSEVGSRARTLF